MTNDKATNTISKLKRENKKLRASRDYLVGYHRGFCESINFAVKNQDSLIKQSEDRTKHLWQTN